MPELNLKQITDKLNAEFSGDTRKLVFWYDEKAEFADDIDTLKLPDAKVYHLKPDNQFYTKYFLERLDKETSYLIYAPFPKPPMRDNHLEDTLLYSKQFFADRVSLLAVDLGIDEKYKPVIQKYIKFFGAKDRTQKFYDLEIENFTRESIEVALMSVLCKTRTASFDELLRVVMTEDSFEDNKFLAELTKYDLLPAFWRLCEEQFGYTDVKPTLEKLVVSMFVTYTARYLKSEVPVSWRSFVPYKSGNIIAFMDNLMNNILYRERYDEISTTIAVGFKVAATLESYEPEDLLDCDTFAVLDSFFLRWISERLMNENTGAKLNGLDIPAICEYRSKKHFGVKFKTQYQMLSSAFNLIGAANYFCPDDMESIYVYHNQIDARGDKPNTEHEVFTACEEAVEEIYDLIKRLSVSANTYHFIVTADHGFIYKRDKLSESNKISGIAGKGNFMNRRFMISDMAIADDGVASFSLGTVLENDDKRSVSFPINSHVFKVPGGGQNYVHGGSSPQEMIVPVIDVRTENTIWKPERPRFRW